MAAKHENKYVLNCNISQLCTLIRDRKFADELNVEMKSENQEATNIWYRFHHGATFTSWGEKITITLTPINQFSTSVCILSECGMPTQVIDWGKNKQNVCNIYEYMERNYKNYPSQQYGANQNFGSSQPANQNFGASQDKFCGKCGKELSPGTAFCGSCGEKIN